MANDSTHEEKVTPAEKPALAPTMGVDESVGLAKSGDLIPAQAEKSALTPASRRGDEMVFVRKDGIEMTYLDGKWLMRDIDLGKLIGLSRPRHIRERIKVMLKDKNKQINDGQLLTVIDDDITIYYVDSSLATTLAFRSNVGNAESIALRMFRVNELFAGTSQQDSISEEKSISAYERAVVRWDQAKTPEAKEALAQAVQRRARIAGFDLPNLAQKNPVGKDQPRLPGV